MSRTFPMEPTEMAPGVVRQVQRSGKDLMLVRITVAKGAVVAPHSHPHEQITYLIEGSADFTLDGEVIHLESGDSVLSPSGATHSVNTLSDCLFLDIFSPPREDFMG